MLLIKIPSIGACVMSAEALSKNILLMATSLINEHGVYSASYSTLLQICICRIKVPQCGENLSLTIYVMQIGVHHVIRLARKNMKKAIKSQSVCQMFPYVFLLVLKILCWPYQSEKLRRYRLAKTYRCKLNAGRINNLHNSLKIPFTLCIRTE